MRRSAFLLFPLLLAFAACGDDPKPQPPPVTDAGETCELPCADACCAEGEVCTEGKCGPAPCVPACAGRECGPDGCGGTCGECGAEQACDEASGACECAPESDTAFCERLEKTCGSVTADDNCGESRTWNCGQCGENELCDLATNTCETLCVPWTDEEFCGSKGLVCGPTSGDDNCGQGRTIADCGQCGADEFCASGACESCLETDEQLCLREGVECGPATLFDLCGNERVIANCADCAQGICDFDNTCIDPNLNDDCTGTRALVFDASGVARAHGDTSTATNDGTAENCPGLGNDVVFSFELLQPSNVDAVLQFEAPIGGSIFQVLSLRRECDVKSTEISCQAVSQEDAMPAAPAELHLRSLLAGTYYLWVDSYSGASGPFRLEVVATPADPAPAHDTCAAPELIAFVDDVATATGSTRDAVDDYSSSCAPKTSPISGGDVVYAFELTEFASVSAVVTPGAADPSFTPAVYLRADCANGDVAAQLACGRSTVVDGVAGPATATAGRLAPGTYYAIVDGLLGTYGDFTLELTRAPTPDNDLCSGALPLSFTNGFATVTGETVFATDDYTGTIGYSNCSRNAMTGGDMVYSFSLTETKLVIATLTADSSDSAFQPGVYLRAACESNTEEDELGCGAGPAGGTATAFAQLTPGDYFVTVDGVSSTKGGFSLEVEARLPLRNDSCARPEPLVFDASGVAVAQSAPDIARADTDSRSCMGSGNDVVYSMTLTAPMQIDATLQTGTTDQASLYLRSSCSDKYSELGCDYTSSGQAPELHFARLEPGTYYLWVDAALSSGELGLTTLTVTATPVAAPAADTCVDAELVQFDGNGVANLTGDTSLATDDYLAGCASSYSPANGPDLVYRIELAEDQALSAKILRDAATPDYRPAISLHSACDAGALTGEVACAVASTSSASFTTSYLPAGTYYLVVDGLYSSSKPASRYGQYALTLELGAPQTNDTCAMPTELVLGSTGLASASGDTTFAASDGTSSGCGGSGGDLVFTFELATRKTVVISAVPDANSLLRPVVYLRKACDDTGTQIACKQASSAGLDATLTLPVLGAGRYYVWVDTYSTTAPGAFSLAINATDPVEPPPFNDVCLGADPIGFVNGLGSKTGDTTFATDDLDASCGVSTGGDVVYSIDVAKNTALQVTLTSTGFKPAVYLLSGCGADAVELECDTGTSTVAEFLVPKLEAGTYYLVVDGLGGAGGPFLLDVAAVPSLINDTCAMPMPIPIDPGTGMGAGSGDNTYAGDDATGSCGSGYKDSVYELMIDGDKTVEITARPVSGSTMRPRIYLRSSCSDRGSELGCASYEQATGAATLTLNRVRPGTYYLWVDATSSSYEDGGFDLTVVTTDPPPVANDTCASPTAFAISASTNLLDDTSFGYNDYSGSCSSSSDPLDGPDVVYEFTLSTPTSLTASVQRATTDYKPALSLRSACNAPDSEIACAKSTTATAPTIHQAYLLPGTYYLIVDGVDRTSGAFTLNVETATPIPNDTCAVPQEIALDPVTGAGSVSGDLTGASNDSSSCRGAGVDLVYAFTLTEERSAHLELSGAALKPTLHVRSSCDDSRTELPMACGYSYTLADTATVDIPRLLPGTYFAWVDSYSATGSGGTFTLSINTDVPAPAPANDTCAAAEALTYDVALDLWYAYGDTTNATNSATGTCDNGASNDLVYRLDLLQDSMITAIVVPEDSGQLLVDPDLKPMVYIRKVCDSASEFEEVTCVAYDYSSDFATAVVNTLSAGTYYVWVDSEKTYGRFRLDVIPGYPLAAPLNETCAFVEPLPFVDGKARVSSTTAFAQNETEGTVCTGAGLFGGDLVWSFTTTATRDILLGVKPSDPAYQPVVYLRSACGAWDAADQLACDKADSAGVPASALALGVPAGEYFVWVDTGGIPPAHGGDFTLSVDLLVPNDTCGSAVWLYPGTTVPGDTVDATDDYGAGPLSAACDASLGASSLDGPDVVYSYTPAADGPFTVTVAPEPNFDAVVWAMPVGCDGVCTAAVDAGGSGAPEALTIDGTANTTYLIVVDSALPTLSGSFTIGVE